MLAHARALLTSTDEGVTAYLHADLRDTGYILREARRILDFGQPIAVLLLAVLHFIPDADNPAGIVAALAEALRGTGTVPGRSPPAVAPPHPGCDHPSGPSQQSLGRLRDVLRA